MASAAPKSFAPKDAPKLNPPNDEPITLADLAKCDGTKITLSDQFHILALRNEGKPC